MKQGESGEVIASDIGTQGMRKQDIGIRELKPCQVLDAGEKLSQGLALRWR
jgi:hypothetical protein